MRRARVEACRGRPSHRHPLALAPTPLPPTAGLHASRTCRMRRYSSSTSVATSIWRGYRTRASSSVRSRARRRPPPQRLTAPRDPGAGPSTGTVRIENCSDCAFTVATCVGPGHRSHAGPPDRAVPPSFPRSRRVALLSCSRCTLFLRVSEPPLVQGCLDLFLGPFNGRFRGLDAVRARHAPSCRLEAAMRLNPCCSACPQLAARAQLDSGDGPWHDPRDAAAPGDAPPPESHISVLGAPTPAQYLPAPSPAPDDPRVSVGRRQTLRRPS